MGSARPVHAGFWSLVSAAVASGIVTLTLATTHLGIVGDTDCPSILGSASSVGQCQLALHRRWHWVWPLIALTVLLVVAAVVLRLRGTAKQVRVALLPAAAIVGAGAWALAWYGSWLLGVGTDDRCTSPISHEAAYLEFDQPSCYGTYAHDAFGGMFALAGAAALIAGLAAVLARSPRATSH